MRVEWMYLNLLMDALTDALYDTYEPNVREVGCDWPKRGVTMIGKRRLRNIQYCVEQVLQREVPGDLIETGVWRGGACIFMRALLKVHGDTTRTVWCADSFQGLPEPTHPEDLGETLHRFPELVVSEAEVAANFKKFGLWDDQVRFVSGWFKTSLRQPFDLDRLAVLRLDGDMYGSTMDALTALYPRLSVGGYVIVDDYGSMATCRKAVDDYREAHGIREDMTWADASCVFWPRLEGAHAASAS